MNQPITLDPDQAEDLHRLLGTVEDWLLHTSFDVLDDLGRFLASLSWGTAAPEQLVTWLINDLGEHTLTLRSITATTDGTGAA
jgi:hypothetical protein